MYKSDIFRTFILVKEQVTDISATLEGLVAERRSIHEKVDAQYTEIASLNRNIQRHQKENRELRKRLEKYEKPDKNSENSGTPPAKENLRDEIIRCTKSLRVKSGLKSGGQPGHEGHTKGMAAVLDVVEECISNYCRECGRDLSSVGKEIEIDMAFRHDHLNCCLVTYILS